MLNKRVPTTSGITGGQEREDGTNRKLVARLDVPHGQRRSSNTPALVALKEQSVGATWQKIWVIQKLSLDLLSVFTLPVDAV